MRLPFILKKTFKNQNESLRTKHFIIIAGEVSGDMHAANLASEILNIDRSVKLSGIGGPRMAQAGIEIYEDLTKLAVVGFSEVIKHYLTFRKIFTLILKKIKDIKPDAVILVDYPGFNLRIAKKLKKLGIKVIYYISPQVWAWKQNRIKLIKECVDKMIVLFDFEKEFYSKHGLNVECAGHPLIDSIKITARKEELLLSQGLHEYKLTIGLLAGSRRNEVENLLPVMIGAAKILHKDFPMMQFLILKSNNISNEMILKHIPPNKFPVSIVENNYYNGLNACDICMVASGTATLETAILQKPMVIVYKTSLFTWILAKLFVKIPNIGLVNVVAGKRIVPECIQLRAKPEILAREIKNIFTDEIKISEIKDELLKVKNSLGLEGASKRAAEMIIRSV